MKEIIDKLDDLELGEKLGGGATANVYKGRWKSQSKNVAVKKVLSVNKREVISYSQTYHMQAGVPDM